MNESGNIKIEIKLPAICSSYYAEVVAINKTLDCIEHPAYNNNLICSDSLSTLLQLKSPHLDPNTYSEIFEIEEKIINLHNENIKVELMYIPAHQGIKINEEADELAKSASETGEIYNNNKVFWKECVHSIKSELFLTSNLEIRQEGKFKGIIYFENVNDYKNNRQWFKKVNWTRNLITMSNRVKSNHTLLPTHLFEKNIVNSPACECGEMFKDLDHIIWDCNSNIGRIKTINQLNNHGIYPGNDVRKFFLEDKIIIMKIVLDFLIENKVKI